MPKTTSDHVDADVMAILKQMTFDGNLAKLPPKQMERKLYERVNKVLERLGGKWKGGKIKAHAFDENPAPLLAEVIATGIMPADNPLDFYRTPDALAERMAKLIPADAERILEPSAGDGTIVKALMRRCPRATIVAVELDPKRAATMRLLGPRVIVNVGDFLSHAETYDAIVMNPPFAVARDKSEYAAHIEHALTLLKPGGRLVSIAPAGLNFRDTARIEELRGKLLAHGRIEELPAGSFDASGTEVATVLVTYDKPGAAMPAPASKSKTLTHLIHVARTAPVQPTLF